MSGIWALTITHIVVVLPTYAGNTSSPLFSGGRLCQWRFWRCGMTLWVKIPGGRGLLRRVTQNASLLQKYPLQYWPGSLEGASLLGTNDRLRCSLESDCRLHWTQVEGNRPPGTGFGPHSVWSHLGFGGVFDGVNIPPHSINQTTSLRGSTGGGELIIAIYRNFSQFLQFFSIYRNFFSHNFHENFEFWY